MSYIKQQHILAPERFNSPSPHSHHNVVIADDCPGHGEELELNVIWRMLGLSIIATQPAVHTGPCSFFCCFLWNRKGSLDQVMDCSSGFAHTVLLSSLKGQRIISRFIRISVLKVVPGYFSQRHGSCLTVVFVCLCGMLETEPKSYTYRMTTESPSHIPQFMSEY